MKTDAGARLSARHPHQSLPKRCEAQVSSNARLEIERGNRDAVYSAACTNAPSIHVDGGCVAVRRGLIATRVCPGLCLATPEYPAWGAPPNP